MLARTPSTFGFSSVSQMFTVAQRRPAWWAAAGVGKRERKQEEKN